jgi:hypothetical protein
MVAGMLMKFVDGDPIGEWCVALLIILTFIPILLFGVYLFWNPDYDVAAALSGDLVARILGPFLDRAEKMAETAMAKVEKGATQLLDQAEKGVSKAHALAPEVSEEGGDIAAAKIKEMKADAKKAKLRAVQIAIQVRQDACPWAGGRGWRVRRAWGLGGIRQWMHEPTISRNDPTSHSCRFACFVHLSAADHEPEPRPGGGHQTPRGGERRACDEDRGHSKTTGGDRVA